MNSSSESFDKFEKFEKYKILNKLPDEELVQKASQDKEAVSVLAVRYMGVVKAYARKFSAHSPQTAEDFVSEGFIGFLNAVKSFDKSKGVDFSAYVSICIKSKILSSMKKNMPQGDGEFFENELENLRDVGEIPEDIVIDKETEDELYEKMLSVLSEFEKKVFDLFLKGMSYSQIASELKVSPKSADNAMQRVRRKIKSIL